MATYQSKEVKITADLKQGDPGFDANVPKVKIKHADGREEVVARDQVQETEGQGRPPLHSQTPGEPPPHANNPDEPPGQAKKPQPK